MTKLLSEEKVMNNADLIERLRRWQALETAGIHGEAANALEIADKRIAELEAEQVAWRIFTDMANRTVDEAERKLAVAREALELNISDSFTKTAMDAAREALAQIS